ncbi:MAG TPA: SH3 domain-containing protein [Firmicutes bacterium]|nr:SH3 domain-containing protein [Candidatus Fermentithermobacillaceae bacterium]
MSIPPRAVRRRAPSQMWWWLPVLLLLGGAVTLLAPSFTYIPKPPDSRPYLVYQGVVQGFPVVAQSEEAYIPFTFVKEIVDPDAVWDGGEVIITTKDKVVKLKTDSLTAYVNQNPVELRLPVILEGNEPYIPAAVLETVYSLNLFHSPEAGTVQLKRNDAWVMRGTVKQLAILREKPSSLARRRGNLDVGDEVEVFHTDGDWLRVESSDGLFGYLRARDVYGIEAKPPRAPEGKPYTPKPIPGRKVSLVWEHVINKNPDPATLPKMKGLNVVSPTWFHLGPTPGEIVNLADMRYVDWAHDNGYQVWALFSNSFDPDLTRAVLRNSSLRDKVASQILILAEIYSLDGINLDFENVYMADAPYLTQFVRELTPLLHQQGLTVSMDVTVRSQSENWSLCYERDRLAESVDYMMLMAYDQYWASSPVAGPVSAIPWAEWTIQRTLEEVPAEKLVLGIPFYTRLWRETESGGAIKVSQEAYSMNGLNNWLSRNGVTPVFDPETGVRYAEKKIGQDNYKVWIEDKDSIKARLELADKYGLAGVAAWRRGFETLDVWDVIDEYVK